jgi:hypothetical protein
MFVPFVKGLVRVVVVAAAVAGCASQTVTVQGAAEQVPLAQRRDARVLVHYSPAVRDARYSDQVVNLAIGAASIERLDQAFAALVSSVTQAPEWPPWRNGPVAVDGVIEVDEAGIEVVTGNDINRPDRVSVRYHACLYRPDSARVNCWSAQSEAVHQRGILEGVSGSVSRLAERAMSDATAGLMLDIDADPAVQAWIEKGDKLNVPIAGSAISRIVVLGWPMDASGDDEGARIERCLRRAIAAVIPEMQIVEQPRVRTALYPLLEPSTQPRHEAEFAKMLARPDVQSRLRSLGVGTILAFAGGTTRGSEKGFVLPAYGPTFGYVWQSEDTRLDAVLWQLEGEPRARSTSAAAHGVKATPVFMLPIPIPARTLEDACEQLAGKIAEMIKAPVAPAL